MLIEEIDKRQAASTGTTKRKTKKNDRSNILKNVRFSEVPYNSPQGRQIQALRQQQATTSSPDASPDDEVDEGYWLVLPLFMVHSFLAWLVRLQYNQKVSWQLVLQDSWPSIPLFALLFAYFHPYRERTWAKVALFVASNVVGDYLIYIANEEGYYATMYKSPPLGTLWVWLFIEMPWHYSTVALVFVALFVWFMDYRL